MVERKKILPGLFLGGIRPKRLTCKAQADDCLPGNQKKHWKEKQHVLILQRDQGMPAEREV